MGGSASVQIVMLGLENTGKTTLLYRLKVGQCTCPIPTIGFNCEKITVTEGKAKGVTFSIWDIGGKDNMRPLWKSYLRSADGILFVVDSSDNEAVEEGRMELLRLVKSQNPGGLPVILVANKQDLPEAMAHDVVGKLMGVHELGSAQACEVLPACAVTGEGLPEVMDCMYELIRKWKKTKNRTKLN